MKRVLSYFTNGPVADSVERIKGSWESEVVTEKVTTAFGTSTSIYEVMGRGTFYPLIFLCGVRHPNGNVEIFGNISDREDLSKALSAIMY